MASLTLAMTTTRGHCERSEAISLMVAGRWRRGVYTEPSECARHDRRVSHTERRRALTM